MPMSSEVSMGAAGVNGRGFLRGLPRGLFTSGSPLSLDDDEALARLFYASLRPLQQHRTAFQKGWSAQ